MFCWNFHIAFDDCQSNFLSFFVVFVGILSFSPFFFQNTFFDRLLRIMSLHVRLCYASMIMYIVLSGISVSHENLLLLFCSFAFWSSNINNRPLSKEETRSFTSMFFCLFFSFRFCLASPSILIDRMKDPFPNPITHFIFFSFGKHQTKKLSEQRLFIRQSIQYI